MEKVCEFCTALRPLVYCNADAAYLCLSCDAKVHWANELSGRHPRTLVCNSCKCHLAHVQCLDHKMLICRDCDQNLHDGSSPHRRRAVKTFIGCPSAKEFATLWGFEFKDIEKCVNQKDQFASASRVSTFDSGSSSRLGQIMFNDQERRTILQQIVDLKRFQLNEENDHSTKINGLHVDEKLNQQAQKSQDSAINLLAEDNPIEEVNLETFSSVFSQLDNLSSSSAMDLPLNGELFWTYKSSLQNNQNLRILSMFAVMVPKYSRPGNMRRTCLSR
ncbi:putative zinc finger protein At1g68190 isoform X2 [Lathyrus oleraceus]|uniref:putative zinc finger protein At1g68190 isoform X2 n=1 Tax=Pisum sativum TaxID=3888 RepID=UPI001FC5FEAF|nr:putative zinc finger protein At1g68190 isoform X2 [Pisum sativum]